jgi:microcystin-dependent protein
MRPGIAMPGMAMAGKMMSGVPIGGVCLYLGQAAAVSDASNPAWQPPGGTRAGANGDDASSAGVGATALLEAMGWMVCDGRTLNVSAFPHLYAALGTLYGGDAQAGTFRLPDLRGVFVRGVDHGAGADPDIGQRRRPDGSGAYAGVGSMQFDALQSHRHDYDQPQGASVSDKGTPSYSVAPKPVPTSEPLAPARISPDETRPRNVAVYYIIRYA